MVGQEKVYETLAALGIEFEYTQINHDPASVPLFHKSKSPCSAYKLTS